MRGRRQEYAPCGQQAAAISIENLVIAELHRQAARFLADNFDVILLPELRDVRDGGARQAQDQKSKTVRNLLTLAHYKFKLFVQAQGSPRPVRYCSDVKRGLHDRRLYPGPERCRRILAVRRWWLGRTASEWTVTTMERVGSTCVRWEISPL